MNLAHSNQPIITSPLHGSGLIGRNWAVMFSSYNYKVQLFDVNKECLAQAPLSIKEEVTKLCDEGLSRGSLSASEQMSLISTTDSLAECVRGATHIQECVFDSLPLKQDLFEEIDGLLGDNTEVAICSSSSIHLPSLLFQKMTKHRDQCLVAHPVNPPMYVQLVEIIPITDVTREEIVDTVRERMDAIGQKPVILLKEISGFALNRLQYAVFQEAFRLVHDGVMSPDDVDTVVSDGLGPRYAFMGPWMTAHLNAHGLADYLERYAEGIYKVGKECQPLLKIEGEAAQKIEDAMIHEVPLDKLNQKRAWRDSCLKELSKVKERLGRM